MKIAFIWATTIFLTFLPSAWSQVKRELSGNLEAQGRHSWNNEAAKKDLLQDWDQEKFYLVYGNLNAKLESENNKLEINWFLRRSYSDLYENNYLAPQIFNFPNRLVARDLFKMQYDKQDHDHSTQSVLNKLFYEWNVAQIRMMVGRMYINYGQGEIFNPINPFNQPTGLTSISQVAQGNDGLGMTYFANDSHTIDFYLLGDKRIEGYNGDISRTLWIHGEYQASENLQLDYVLGEDQNRDKIGGQLSYQFDEAMVFLQSLYQTEYVKNKEAPSHNLWDGMIGYDQQMTSKWHIRSEAGYQKTNRFANLSNFGERFLPTEYFIALANQYEIHPLIKLNGTLINDIKSGFTYFIARSTFDLGHNIEADIYAYSPVSKGDDADNVAQKLVTTDVGMALRTFF